MKLFIRSQIMEENQKEEVRKAEERAESGIPQREV